MGSYYYLGAQLPYLIYGQNPPMSSQDFLALARDQMSSADAALLDYCTLDPSPYREGDTGPSYTEQERSTHSTLLNRWKEWERALRLNLASNRALKLKREGVTQADAPVIPADAANVAKNAMAIESPLEAEIFLDNARWNAIESFQDLSVFSESSIYAYLLKLLLMERRAAFKTEDGFDEYKGLYAAILGEAK